MNVHSLSSPRTLFSRPMASAFAVMFLAGIASTPAGATIPVSNTPLFLPQEVPGNLFLTPSVEWPTIEVSAYKNHGGGSTESFARSDTYTGLFDASFCYRYVYDPN